jgi:hypothetical protein
MRQRIDFPSEKRVFMGRKRVLVTGAAGRIGQAVVAALRSAGHQVLGWDCREGPGVERIGHLTSFTDVSAAVQGQEVVIHLAATPDDAFFPPGSQDNFLDELLPNNVVGIYHVLEAARRAQATRLILASTGQVVWEAVRHGPWPLTAQTPWSPRYWYACTKVMLEAAGQVYARQFGLTVLAIRLGWCPRTAAQVEEISREVLWQDIYLSPGDAGRFMVAAVGAESLTGFHILYATSRPRQQVRYDLETSRRLIGYQPQDCWPEGIGLLPAVS